MCLNNLEYNMDRFLIVLVNEVLSQAELIIALTKSGIKFQILEKNETFVILDVENKEELTNLGGIYKIGKIICSSSSVEGILEKIRKDRKLIMLDDKQQWNLSYYSDEIINMDIYEELQNGLASLIKENSTKTKFIRNNMKSENFIELSVDKEKKDAIKILVGKNKEKYYVAENIISIKSSNFIDRDLSRPYQDSRISLSPRTARMLVNMLGLEKGKTILDPFCGTGTFLIESIIQGYKVIGVDNRKECVAGTKKNLLWIMKEQKLNNKIRYVKQDNAEKLSTINSLSVDGIVTEPILLPNFKNNPNFEMAENELRKSKAVYEHSLLAMYRVLNNNGKVCIVTPRIKTRDNRYITFSFKKMLKKAGFILDDRLNEQPFVMKPSGDQKVLREIWLLKKS